MGNAAYAILAYGHAWDEGEEKPWEYEEGHEDEDWEERIVRLSGRKLPPNPWDGAEAPASYNYQDRRVWWDTWTNDHRVQIDAHASARKELIAELSEGCEVDTHSSCDYPCYYVHSLDKKQQASWDGPQSVTRWEEGTEEDQARLRRFCERLGINPPQRFGWFLTSYWG